MLLDTTYDIATPEGVELRLPLAGLASRALAWLVDALIKFGVFLVLAIILQFFDDLGDGILLICMFTLLWLYNVLFEVFNHGATPGKRALGIRVMHQNGTPVGWSGSILRNLIRFVDTLPGCYAFGCLTVLISKNFQRLGDLAAGTVVVYQTQANAKSHLNSAEPVAVKIPLTPDEQQAIVSFGERATLLNSERADELASVLVPMITNVTSEQLRGHASWLGGGQGS